MPRVLNQPTSTGNPGLQGSLDVLQSTQAVYQALDKNDSPIHIHKLSGSSKALLISEIRRRTRRPILVVAASEENADFFRADLEVFLSEPVHHFAAHQTDPYQTKTYNTGVTAARMETMTHLTSGGDGVVVTSPKALLDQVVSPGVLQNHVIQFRIDKTVDLESIITRLTYLGYNREQAVEEVGDYALRGGILDIYSLGGEHPFRIEIEYDSVSSIREFDVHTQRSLRALETATVVPRHEMVLDEAKIAEAVAMLSGEDAEAGQDLAEAFETEVHPPGIERIAGSLGQELGSFLDYLAPDTVVFVEEPAMMAATVDALWTEVQEAYQSEVESFPHMSKPDELFLDPGKLHTALLKFFGIRFSDLTQESGDARLILFRSSPPDSFGRKIDLWRDYLRGLLDRGHRITIFCDNEGQRKRLQELLVEEAVPVTLQIGVLSAGFMIDEGKLGVLTDHEFFGRPRRRSRPSRFRSGFGLKELRSLKPGAFVVHIDHGIGRYLGLTRLDVNGHMTDVLELSYLGNDKLYVPVAQLDLIQKYSSEEGRSPGLSRLGGKGWDKAKTKAKKAIKEMAGELVRLYARRKANPGHAFSPDTPWQRELEGSFPFEETPDQRQAVERVKLEMEEPSPMDHLICGDVGYGKTEVAIRAAFKAIQDGKQVAMLVPTTILAEQHFKTFQERFAGFPVEVEMLSRFRNPKEKKAILEGLKNGRIDMVVGTHALLGKTVVFKSLGLLVVDEEQRFGVGHKEKIKQLKTNVDVLTLTATPIPRTLNLSLLGVRDITVIQTPPVGRMPVRTEIAEFNRDLIREALLREADRGGQSFFVHNRVQSIQSMAAYIERLCPELTVLVGHGQLPERALEKVMHEFVAGRADVLVATMIIENGLDIPSVNTMIVNRANAFGLSQLYQLRGRVGRSTQKASCHFLLPANRALTDTAMKRLRAIAEFDELGSGFALAMRDLEIRGSGNILGAEQSGHVISVGFEMYCRLVDEAVREVKGLPLAERPLPRITADADAYLSDDYVEDAEEKVGFYKRLADTSEISELDKLEEELQDRFGKLAPQAETLFELRRLRLLGAEVGAASISVRGNKIEIELLEPPAPGHIKKWMKNITIPVEFATSGRFALRAEGGIPETRDLLLGMAKAVPGDDAVGDDMVLKENNEE